MPWFLKRFIKLHIVCVILLLVAMLLFAMKMYTVSAMLILGIMYIYFTIFIYKVTLRKSEMQNMVFSPQSKVRNVQYLIIGDMYKAEENGESVQIFAPERGLEACYEILKSTHSILKDNGGIVVIALKKRNVKKRGYSIFDMPFFHHITLERMRLEGSIPKQSIKHVMLHPIIYLIFALDIKCKGYKERNISEDVISKFCDDRGYKLIFKLKD